MNGTRSINKRTEPMRRGHAHDADGKAMQLPAGKACADCRHCARCCGIFGHIPADEVCDFYPSRFAAKPDQGAAA